MATKNLYLAAGCFWGAAHLFKQVRGVVATEAGFANGHTDNPTYEEVYTDTTGHAETVRVEFDDKIVSEEVLLRLFFKAINPTQTNGQGPDIGTRYRSGIYYERETTHALARQIMKEVQATLSEPCTTEILPLRCFFPASNYHQDYLQKNPAGYCHLPIHLFAYAKQLNEDKNLSKV